MRAFLIALQFLTRVPVAFGRAPDAAETARSMVYFPLVGLMIGLLLSALAWLFAGLSPLLSGALLLSMWVLLTGGLHLDGLADSADAWAGGGGDRQRMLTIMKDPYSGPIGVTTVVLVIVLKFAALVSLLELRAFAALFAAPLLARASLPLLFLTTPYVRPAGLGTPFAGRIPRKSAATAIVLSYLAVALTLGLAGLWAGLIGLAAFFVLRTFMCRQLGGTTGDTAGATVELTETAVLLSIALALAWRSA